MSQIDPSLYGVIGLAIVWLGTIFRLYLTLKDQSRSIKTNGEAQHHNELQIELLVTKVRELEKDNERWQLRALSAEEELRRRDQC